MKTKLLLFVLAFAFTSSIFSQEVKIGIINGQKIVENSQRGKEVQRELESQQKESQAEIGAMQDQIKNKQKYLNDNVARLSETEQLELKAELEDFKVQYARKVDDFQKEMQILSNQMMSELQDEIMPLIQQMGREMGFTLILDITNSGIAYYDQGIDITQEIVRMLDERSR